MYHRDRFVAACAAILIVLLPTHAARADAPWDRIAGSTELNTRQREVAEKILKEANSYMSCPDTLWECLE